MFEIHYTSKFVVFNQTGTVSTSHTCGASRGKTVKRTRSDITATPAPTFAISEEGMLQGAAAIAFGGVDTGKQYAKEQLRAAGIMRNMG